MVHKFFEMFAKFLLTWRVAGRGCDQGAYIMGGETRARTQSRSPSLRSSCRGIRGFGIIHNRKPEILALIKLRMRY